MLIGGRARRTRGYKAVRDSKLPFLMLQAIKELKAQNDALEERVRRQEERLARIEATLAGEAAPRR